MYTHKIPLEKRFKCIRILLKYFRLIEILVNISFELVIISENEEVKGNLE